MNATELAKALGLELCNTDEYKNFIKAKAEYEKDADLEALIEAYNMEKLRLDIIKNQGSEDDKKESSTDRLNQLYQQIMMRDSMKNYNDAHEALGRLMDDINAIIIGAMNEQEGCTPEKCASCGMCNH